jgi:hypothetical protein
LTIFSPVLHSHGRGDVVYDPVVVVLILDEGRDTALLGATQVLGAELHAVGVGFHLKQVGGVLDVVAGEPLSQIFRVCHDVNLTRGGGRGSASRVRESTVHVLLFLQLFRGIMYVVRAA